MLKAGVTDRDIRVYELYLQRVTQEGKWFWSRFNIYFGFNSAVVVVIGYLLKPFIDTACIRLTELPHLFLIPLTILGLCFSIAWFLININGRKWTLFFNEKVAKVEKEIFEKAEDYGLYVCVKKEYSVPALKKDVMDVMDISICLSLVFATLWILFLVFESLVCLGVVS